MKDNKILNYKSDEKNLYNVFKTSYKQNNLFLALQSLNKLTEMREDSIDYLMEKMELCNVVKNYAKGIICAFRLLTFPLGEHTLKTLSNIYSFFFSINEEKTATFYLDYYTEVAKKLMPENADNIENSLKDFKKKVYFNGFSLVKDEPRDEAIVKIVNIAGSMDKDSLFLDKINRQSTNYGFVQTRLAEHAIKKGDTEKGKEHLKSAKKTVAGDIYFRATELLLLKKEYDLLDLKCLNNENGESKENDQSLPEDTNRLKNNEQLKKARISALNKFNKKKDELKYDEGLDLKDKLLLGTMFMEAGIFNDAIYLFKQMAKIFKCSEVICYNLAVCYLKQGLNKEADHYFKKVLIINPDNAIIKILNKKRKSFRFDPSKVENDMVLPNEYVKSVVNQIIRFMSMSENEFVSEYYKNKEELHTLFNFAVSFMNGDLSYGFFNKFTLIDEGMKLISSKLINPFILDDIKKELLKAIISGGLKGSYFVVINGKFKKINMKYPKLLFTEENVDEFGNWRQDTGFDPRLFIKSYAKIFADFAEVDERYETGLAKVGDKLIRILKNLSETQKEVFLNENVISAVLLYLVSEDKIFESSGLKYTKKQICDTQHISETGFNKILSMINR